MQTRLKKALAVKAVERQKDMIRPLVVDLIAPLGDGGTFDFAEAMLAMPMSVTGTMMDLPRADWSWLSGLTTICIAADDPEYQDGAARPPPWSGRTATCSPTSRTCCASAVATSATTC